MRTSDVSELNSSNQSPLVSKRKSKTDIDVNRRVSSSLIAEVPGSYLGAAPVSVNEPRKGSLFDDPGSSDEFSRAEMWQVHLPIKEKNESKCVVS